MTNDRFIELERRLARAENELETTRAQVQFLRERPRARLRRDGILGLLCLVLVIVVTRALVTEAQGARPEVLTVKAPFQVVDAGGKVILRADTGGLTMSDLASGGKVILRAVSGPTGKVILKADTGLTIGDPASGGVELGTGGMGNGFVTVRTAAGRHAIDLGNFVKYRGGATGVHVINPDGETVEASLVLVPASNKAVLQVGAANNSGGAEIGIGQNGNGYMKVLRDDGKNGVALGRFLGRPMSVTVFGDKENELVSLRTDEKGGRVQVWTPAGGAVAGLFAGNTGGGLALTGPAGGKSAVSLSVTSTGGNVRVFGQAGGSAQAELTAESSGGAFTAYSASGKALVFFGAKEGKGQLEINDAAGVKMVAAGSLANHKGVVYASPWRPSSDVHGDPSVLKGGRNVGEK